MLASVVIGWAAEVTAVHLSAGIALAILAWLQTSPEFAVEATIAWSRDSNLVLANFTGSLRLLLGLGWPMVFFVHWFTQRKGKLIRDVRLPAAFSVEAAGLIIPVIYFFGIYLKRTWDPIDGAFLISAYVFYFWMLNRQHKSGMAAPSEESEPWIVQKILHQSKGRQHAIMLGMFVFGAGALLFAVHPFIEALKAAALSMGVSEFVFIQWIAPIASEFPEKITAFNWARRASKVPYAIVNMISSVTSQWTLLAGLVPIIYSVSGGRFDPIHLSEFQRTEILLTVLQSLLAVVFLADLKITWYETIGIFALWLVQFFIPHTRTLLVPVYGVWIGLETLRLLTKPKEIQTVVHLRQLFRRRAA